MSIAKVFDFLGNMGLMARGDKPKVVELKGRAWGGEVAGLSLSAQQTARQDADELPTLSLVLRNNGAETIQISAAGWLSFYRLEVTTAEGAAVALSPYGTQLLNSSRRTEHVETPLAPGAVTEALVPIGSLYAMRPRQSYRVTASCTLANGTSLVSNEAPIV